METGLVNLREPAYTAPSSISTGNQGDPFTRGSPVTLLKRTGDMNAQELRNKTLDQLREDLAALKKEAFNLRFQQATGQLESTARMKTVRRDVARVKTVLNEKAASAAAE